MPLDTNTIYPCPVCGFLTFDEPPGSYAICPVCNWEDDALQLEFATSLAGGANSETLAAAQEAFGRAAGRQQRRHPGTEVPRKRDPDWRPVDPARDRFPLWGEETPGRLERGEWLYYWRKPV